MSDSARKEVEARYKLHFDLCAKQDFDGIAEEFVEDAVLLPNGVNPIVGRAAIIEALHVMLPGYQKLVPISTEYFELLNENTAYTNGFVDQVNKDGQPVAHFHDTFLWRKVDGQWYIQRQMFANRERSETAKNTIKQEIEARYDALIELFNKDDYDSMFAMYSDDLKTTAPLQKEVTGKEANKAVFADLLPPSLKTAVKQELTDFRVFDDHTAVTSANVATVDDNKKVKQVTRDLVIWKKVNGEWLVTRCIQNQLYGQQ